MTLTTIQQAQSLISPRPMLLMEPSVEFFLGTTTSGVSLAVWPIQRLKWDEVFRVMRLLSVILILFTAGPIFASPHDYLPPKHDGSRNEERIRECVRKLMWKEETKKGLLDKIYKDLSTKEKIHILSFITVLEKFDYNERRSENFINSEAESLDESLSKCSLDQKYLILKALFAHINEWSSNEVPLLVAQHIVNSVPKTQGTAPELMLSHMETFIQNVFPAIPSIPEKEMKRIALESWYDYSIEQANNTWLSEPLRKKFGELTTTLYELMKNTEDRATSESQNSEKV